LLQGRSCFSVFLASVILGGCGGVATDSSLFQPAGDDSHTGANTIGATSDVPNSPGAAPLNTGTDNGAPPPATCMKATTRVDIAANLDAGARSITARWSPSDPYANTNYVSMTTIFDSLGHEHELAITFRKSGMGTFEYHALVDTYTGVSNIESGTEVSAGLLSFAPSGALRAVTTTKVGPVVFDGSSEPRWITVGFGAPMADGASGLTGTISVASPFLVLGQWQDGSGCGGEAAKPHPCAWPIDAQGLLDPSRLDSSICG
jgi:flagellar hook protein FlgE